MGSWKRGEGRRELDDSRVVTVIGPSTLIATTTRQPSSKFHITDIHLPFSDSRLTALFYFPILQRFASAFSGKIPLLTYFTSSIE